MSVRTSTEAEEAVTELFAQIFGPVVSSYTNVETGQVTVSAFLAAKPGRSGAWRAQLAQGLERMRTCGLELAPGKVKLARIRSQDWAESWKRHFRPLRIGAKLLIKPSWSRLRARQGQQMVVLDPGLSFGTGQHPTTAFCLQQLVKRRIPGRSQAFLDAGTGSGILAIAAARLGYAPVRALDVDPEAVRMARANARVNRVLARIDLKRRDLAQLPLHASQKYSLICANLVSSLLLTQRDRLVARLAPGGVLVLAGILATEFEKVQRAYADAGLRLTASRRAGEWRSGAFVTALFPAAVPHPQPS